MSRRSRRTMIWEAAALALMALALVGIPAVALLVPLPTTIRLQGSTTIGGDLAPALAVGYLTAEGVPPAQIRTSTTSDGADTVIEGTRPGDQRPTRFEITARGTAGAFDPDDTDIDIGMASRTITEVEERSLDRGELRFNPSAEYIVALDGVAIVVNNDVDVPRLSVDQLRSIFTCTTTNWTGVVDGAADQPITVVSTGPASGTFDLMQEKVLGEEGLCRTARVRPSGAAVADTVRRTPGAIGFVPLPQVGDLTVVPVFSGDSQPIAPSAFTVSTESYLLTRRLQLYLFPDPEPRPEALGLVEFALSDEGQRIVADLQFVPINASFEADPPPPAEDGRVDAEPVVPTAPLCAEPPLDYVTAVSGAVRRPTDVRFTTGSSQLDTRAVRDIDDLVGELRADPGRQVVLAGFADAAGLPEYNLELSRTRTAAVEQSLRRLGVTNLAVGWFGEACPVDSNDSDTGRERNRRVEIWLRQ